MRKSAETNLPRMPIRASGPGSRAAKHIVALLSLVLFTASHDKAAHGGAGAQLDEVLAQLVYLDADGNPSFGQPPITLYTLRDANFNVVALADEYGRLAAQYTYDPHGKVRSAELMANPATGPPIAAVYDADPNATTSTYWNRVLAAARTNRLGFQGLPAERLDVDGPWLDPLGTDGLASWGGGTNTGILGGVPPASHEVVYHARNRVFSPRHQRFTSVDPNATGVPILDGLSFGGIAIGPSSIDPDYLAHFGDGMNAHAAFASNPIGLCDPLGLFTTAHLAPLAPGAAAAILRNALFGGVLGGLAGGLSAYATDGTGEEIAYASLAGAASGAVGGAYYGFASSLSGLITQVGSRELIAVVTGGFAGGSVHAGLYGASSAEQVFAGLISGATGAGLFKGGQLFGRMFTNWGADDAVLATFARPSDGYLARVFAGHANGQGFSCAYNRATGTIAARPSTNGAGDPVPPGWVPRRGGHRQVGATLNASERSDLVGFTAFLENGGLRVHWLSRSLNNQHSRDGYAPEQWRGEIIRSLESATGMRVH
ncbi:MAG: hypothetical protein KF768_13880 [Phycisphaeraceae bacterium]|nr:hypothetical protein [Phycisphaeraceae bacterium]